MTFNPTRDHEKEELVREEELPPSSIRAQMTPVFSHMPEMKVGTLGGAGRHLETRRPEAAWKWIREMK